jgi:hypothetical protein
LEQYHFIFITLRGFAITKLINRDANITQLGQPLRLLFGNVIAARGSNRATNTTERRPGCLSS